MPFIQQKYPLNIQEKDKPVFDVGLEHYIADPVLNIYTNCWWNPFTRKELKGFVAKVRQVIISVLKFRPIKRIDKAAWVTDGYSANYFHWINDVLPKVLFLQSKNIQCPVLIPKEFSKCRYVEESLQLLGISYILWPTQGINFIHQLYIPEVGASGGQDLFYFPLLHNKLRAMTLHVSPSKKLFISRQKANTRKIVFFDEIENIISQNGFEIVCPEMLSFKEQGQLFSSATHIIGIHGAGLSNMIFMGSGCRVLEIRRSNDFWNYCYYFMASTLNLGYYYFMAEGAGVSTVVQGDNLIINSAEFQLVLKDFINNPV